LLYASTLFENKDLLLALGGAGCRVWASMASIEAVVTQLPTSVEGDSLGLAPYFLGCWKGVEEIDEEFKSRASKWLAGAQEIFTPGQQILGLPADMLVELLQMLGAESVRLHGKPGSKARSVKGLVPHVLAGVENVQAVEEHLHSSVFFEWFVPWFSACLSDAVGLAEADDNVEVHINEDDDVDASSLESPCPAEQNIIDGGGLGDMFAENSQVLDKSCPSSGGTVESFLPRPFFENVNATGLHLVQRSVPAVRAIHRKEVVESSAEDADGEQVPAAQSAGYTLSSAATSCLPLKTMAYACAPMHLFGANPYYRDLEEGLQPSAAEQVCSTSCANFPCACMFMF
jgi:hypothetical protein